MAEKVVRWLVLQSWRRLVITHDDGTNVRIRLGAFPLACIDVSGKSPGFGANVPT